MTTQLPPAMRFIQKVDAAHNIFRSVLGAATPDEVFLERRVTFSQDWRRLSEKMDKDRPLAEAVLGADFPRVCGPVELDHFAPLDALKGIVTSGQLHLHPVANYLHEDEFATFAREHDLNGYFDFNDRGQKVLEELSQHLFFISMTRPGNPEEATLWEGFANRGRGVRLRLRVTPQPPADLRTMSYPTDGPTALKQINDDLLANEGLVYIPWTISRICAFYLPLGYRHEREVRMILKRHEGGLDRTVTRGQHTVWPVPLASAGGITGDNWCEVELVGVKAGPRCSSDAVQSVLADTAYWGVPVS